APNIALPPNGRIPQAPKPGPKTGQHQSKDADKDIELEPPAPTPAAPHPAAPRPALHKKSGAVSRVAPGADAEDEAFIPSHALQKRIPHCTAKDSNPPPPPQPHPLSVSPSHSPSPDTDDTDKTPPPPPSQPHQPPPPL
ncbi:hypothetical protein DXG01_007071, partial [Tephrocybe rancida]